MSSARRNGSPRPRRALRDYATLPKRWAICGVTGRVRGAPLPYWAFLRREPAWVQVVRWTPASGSWSTVKALADSIAAAQAPVVNP